MGLSPEILTQPSGTAELEIFPRWGMVSGELCISRGHAMFLNLPVPLVTVLLLIGSNCFMTYAWYGHLRHQAMPVMAAVPAPRTAVPAFMTTAATKRARTSFTR